MLSFSQAQGLFNHIPAYAPFGSSNKRHENTAYARLRIAFIRTLIHYILQTLIDSSKVTPDFEEFFKKYDFDDDLFHILQGVFAMAVGFANCGELSSLAFNCSSRHACRKEILTIASKVDTRLKDHDLVVFNRDPSTPVDNPKFWNKKTIVFDFWGNQLYELNGSFAISKSTFARAGEMKGEEDDISISIDISKDMALSPADCERIAHFLKTIIAYFKKEGELVFAEVAKSKDVRWIDINVEYEIFQFIKTINEQIAYYESLFPAMSSHLLIESKLESKLMPKESPTPVFGKKEAAADIASLKREFPPRAKSSRSALREDSPMRGGKDVRSDSPCRARRHSGDSSIMSRGKSFSRDRSPSRVS